ncbi:MAG TPA: hypothetical protein VMT45_10835 [Thermoanaerobaculaceae bacterium]|nr:hypothetical protein [Thermoanaerobaculaceae bacterium]
MKRLGEILMAKGMVSADGLRAGLDACRRHGGRLGTWLVRLGLVSEGKLLDALAEQSGCPPATTLQLATAASDVRAVIPSAFAKRNLVVAFARHGRNIDVAMIRPNDLLLVDEISKVTGLVPRPHVATEAALTAALALPGAAAPAAPPPPGPPQGTVREWRQFWKLESSPTELMRSLEAPALKPPATAAATFPHLTPLAAATGPVTARETQDLADALSAATHRDQVAGIVLSNLAGMAQRVALFSLYQNKVMGWAARGASIVEEDFHTLILPLDRPSLFLNLSKGVDIHAGPLGPGEGNDLLLDALGSPPPKEAVVVPVRVRGKTAGFLWLDQGEEGVGDISIPTVQEVARLIGLALEILVLRQKVRAGARLTGGGPPD